MQEARRAKSGRRTAAKTPRVSKFLAASVAVAGAAAIAVNPVSPVVEEANAASVEQRNVALTAAADPLVLIQQSIAKAFTNLGYLNVNGTNSAVALAAAFQSADPLGELVDVISANATNPTPFIERLLAAPEVYGDDIQVALFGNGIPDNPATPTNEHYAGVFERLQLAPEEFQAMLEDLANYDPPATDPTQGRFTNMAFELNNFFVFGVLDNLRPLIGATPSGIVPLFSIPGDFLGGETAGGFEGALPGVDRLDNLVNVLNEQTLVRAAVGPFQTSFFRIAQSLDDALEAYEAGDTELAVNELTNLPIRAVDAFVNGFAPSFSPGGANWPSLIDVGQQQAGLFKYLAVDLPNQITTALTGNTTPPEYETPAPPPAPTARGASPQAITVEEKIEAPVDSSKDAAVLASDTTVVDDTKTETTSTKPVKKTYKPGDGLRALKKAGDDLNKFGQAVSSALTPKKKDSVKAEPTVKAGESQGGDNKDEDTTSTDTEKSEGDSSE